MAAIVPMSEDDPILSVVQFTADLAWSDAGPEVAETQVTKLCREAQEFMLTNQWLKLASLMLASADVVFSRVSEKDLECIFAIICSLVKNARNPDEELEMARLISAKIVQQPNDKPALRLKILFNLYNLLENPYSRFTVYKDVLQLALDGKLTEQIVPSLKKIDSYVKEWNIGVTDQRELFRIISYILKENKSLSKDYFYFLKKYLSTFTDVDSYSVNEVKEHAVQAIIEFVKAPDMFQCDLLDMPAVVQLQKDEKFSLVYLLLKIFLTQRLDAYLDFHASNSSLLASNGLAHEDCITKMRLLSLADLGANESGRIPYAVIKDTLRVTEDEVESWILKAIIAKLLDCKMDQMNQVVLVSRTTNRVFGMEQWRSLHSKLEVWKGNVGNVISTIRANKLSEDGGTQSSAQSLMIR